MIFDAGLQLAGIYNPATNGYLPQLITALGVTNSTNQIDTTPSLAQAQSQPAALGNGNVETAITIAIMQTLTSAGAALVKFQLVQADDAALSAGVQVLRETEAFAYTALIAGTKIVMRWPAPGAYSPKRYAGLRVVISGAVLTNSSGWLLASTGQSTQDIASTFKTGYTIQ